MTQCKVQGCTNTDLIYSGIDAFCREIPVTETYCYPCGNAFYFIKKDIEAFLEKHASEIQE